MLLANEIFQMCDLPVTIESVKIGSSRMPPAKGDVKGYTARTSKFRVTVHVLGGTED